MKRTIGICVFAGVLLALGVFGFLFLEGSNGTKEQQEMPMANATETEEAAGAEVEEIMKVQEPFQYLIREKDGVLVVYEQDGETVLLETNIKVDTLREEEQELFRTGVPVLDERELYDLLESYSS